MSGAQYVNQWIRPHFWFVIYADPLTCHNEPPPLNEIVEFEMEFFNPDSSGAPTDHFGDEQRGTYGSSRFSDEVYTQFHCTVCRTYVLLYTIYTQSIWSIRAVNRAWGDKLVSRLRQWCTFFWLGEIHFAFCYLSYLLQDCSCSIVC